MTKLVAPTLREPLVERDNTISRAWGRWLGQLSQRLGYGAAPVWRSVSENPYGWSSSATPVAVQTEFNVLGLPNSGSPFLTGSVDLPREYSDGGAVYIWADHYSLTDATGTQTNLTLSYSAGNPVPAATSGTTNIAGTTGLTSQRQEWAIADTSTLRGGDKVYFRLTRNSSDPDDTSTDTFVIPSVGLTFEAYGIGRFDR